MEQLIYIQLMNELMKVHRPVKALGFANLRFKPNYLALSNYSDQLAPTIVNPYRTIGETVQ